MKPHRCGWECTICGYRHTGTSPEAVFKARDKHVCGIKPKKWWEFWK